jgi:hypothetical protein
MGKMVGMKALRQMTSRNDIDGDVLTVALLTDHLMIVQDEFEGVRHEQPGTGLLRMDGCGHERRKGGPGRLPRHESRPE